MGRDARKPVFEVSDEERFKSACSATVTIRKLKFCSYILCSKSRCYTFKLANNKGADQPVRMCRLCLRLCCSQNPKTGFITSRPRYKQILESLSASYKHPHAYVSSGARGLIFGLSLHLHQYFVYASREGSSEFVHIHTLGCMSFCCWMVQ